MSISLTDAHAAAIEAEVAAGAYASVSEVVRAALREHFDRAPGPALEMIERDIRRYLEAREAGEPLCSAEEARRSILAELDAAEPASG